MAKSDHYFWTVKNQIRQAFDDAYLNIRIEIPDTIDGQAWIDRAIRREKMRIEVTLTASTEEGCAIMQREAAERLRKVLVSCPGRVLWNVTLKRYVSPQLVRQRERDEEARIQAMKDEAHNNFLSRLYEKTRSVEK